MSAKIECEESAYGECVCCACMTLRHFQTWSKLSTFAIILEVVDQSETEHESANVKMCQKKGHR